MNTSFALTACAVAGMLIGNLAVMADKAKVFQPAANEVANKPVANEVANKPVTTETEVYKVVCTSETETFCKEYSVRRITRE